ncbi:TPA: hypothetical protein ACH3X1_015279 [Trebouxia sp. C0004]
MCYAAFSMQKRCCRRFVASKARSRLVSTASLTVSLAAAADANVRSRSTSCMLWYKYSQFSKPWPQGVENERILSKDSLVCVDPAHLFLGRRTR